MKHLCSLSFFALLTGCATSSPPSYVSEKEEAVSILSSYIQLNTSNPPGNELQAAKFFKSIFDREGIEAQIIETSLGRGNVYARLRGNGTGKAVLLLHHMDTVAADHGEWSVDPFAGAMKDGNVWGRGALDMKGMGVVNLMTMLALKRQHVSLASDIIFLGVADEEEGGRFGASTLLGTHFHLFRDVGVVLNEGGYIAVNGDGKAQNYRVETSQKLPLWLKLIAKGESGHSSTPRQETAVSRLISALQRVLNHQTALKVEPLVQQYYVDTAHLAPSPAWQEQFRDLRNALRDPRFADEFVKSPGANAVVRNTVAITMLQASPKINVLSSEASAHLDVRLLPSEDPRAFITELRKVISDETIKIEPILSFPASSSSTQSRFIQIIGEIAKRDDPDAVVSFPLVAGFTDCHYFRERGIPCYGFLPFKLGSKELIGYHGKDERLSIKNLESGMQLMFELANKLANE